MIDRKDKFRHLDFTILLLTGWLLFLYLFYNLMFGGWENWILNIFIESIKTCLWFRLLTTIGLSTVLVFLLNLNAEHAYILTRKLIIFNSYDRIRGTNVSTLLVICLCFKEITWLWEKAEINYNIICCLLSFYFCYITFYARGRAWVPNLASPWLSFCPS